MMEYMYEKLQRFTWADGLLILGIGLIVVGLGINWADKFKNDNQKTVLKKITPTQVIDVQREVKVTIDISGEVISPGIYQLKSGSRINEVLVMAGGLGAKADREWVEKNINRAEILKDGQKIYIPKINESLNSKVQNQTQILGVNTGVISLNLATVAELDTLNGIGPALAQRIIDYREKNGGFKNVEEIKLVSGIGDKLFEKIKGEIGL